MRRSNNNKRLSNSNHMMETSSKRGHRGKEDLPHQRSHPGAEDSDEGKVANIVLSFEDETFVRGRGL